MTAPVNLLAPTPPGVTPETLAGPLAEANTGVVDATLDFSAALEALLAVLNVPLLNPEGSAPQEATAPQGDPVSPELAPPQLVLTPTLALPTLEMPAGTPASLNLQEQKTEKVEDAAANQAALAVALMVVPPPQVLALGAAPESAPTEGTASAPAPSLPAGTPAPQVFPETPLNAAPPLTFSSSEPRPLSLSDAAPESLPIPEAVPTPEAFSLLGMKPSAAESLPLETPSMNPVVNDKPETAILSTLPLDTPPSLPEVSAVETGPSLNSQPKSVPSPRSNTSASDKTEPQLPAPFLAEGRVDSAEVVTQESRPAAEEPSILAPKEKSSPKEEGSTPHRLSPAPTLQAPLIHPVNQGSASQPKDDMSPRKEIRLEVLETGPKVEGSSSSVSSVPVLAPAAAPTLGASASIDAPTLIRHLAERIDTQWRAGDSRINLALNPPDLGSVKISVETHQDHMTVRFNVEQANVQQVVQAHLPELKQALSDRGWDVSTLQVSVGGMGVDQGQKDGGQNLPTANNNRIPQEGSMNELTSPETSLSDPYLVDMVA